MAKWWHFQTHFLEWKLLHFYSNFIAICSQASKYQYVSIGSDDGLAPNRRQAITWTNTGPVYWCIYVSFSLNELTGAVLMTKTVRNIFFKVSLVINDFDCLFGPEDTSQNGCQNLMKSHHTLSHTLAPNIWKDWHKQMKRRTSGSGRSLLDYARLLFWGGHMLAYDQLDPCNKFQWNSNKNTHFLHTRKWIQIVFDKWQPFSLGLNVNIHILT